MPSVPAPGRRCESASWDVPFRGAAERHPALVMGEAVADGARDARCLAKPFPAARSGRRREASQQLLARLRAERRRPRGEELGKASFHPALERDVVLQHGRAVEEAEPADVSAEDVGVVESRGTAGGEEEELPGARAMDEVDG